MLVEALNPLAIAFVGFRPALDLPGEAGGGGDDVEAGFEQGEEENVTVDAAGFEGDGGDAAPRQPGDELPQAGRMGGELAHGVAVGRLIDADPMRGIADVDAGGVGVLDRQRGELGAFVGVASRSLRHAADRFEVVGRVGRRGLGCGQVGDFSVAVVHGRLHNGKEGKSVRRGSQQRGQPSQRDRPRPCEAVGGRRQTNGPKIAPQPNRTIGLSMKALIAPET